MSLRINLSVRCTLGLRWVTELLEFSMQLVLRTADKTRTREACGRLRPVSTAGGTRGPCSRLLLETSLKLQTQEWLEASSVRCLWCLYRSAQRASKEPVLFFLLLVTLFWSFYEPKVRSDYLVYVFPQKTIFE